MAGFALKRVSWASPTASKKNPRAKTRTPAMSKRPRPLPSARGLAMLVAATSGMAMRRSSAPCRPNTVNADSQTKRGPWRWRIAW